MTFDRRMFGPDTPASLTFDELKMVCGMRDAVATMDANPVDKDEMAERLQGLREIFGRSLAPVSPIPAGAALRPEMLTMKEAGRRHSTRGDGRDRGRRLAHDVTPDRILRWSDLVKE